MTEKIRKNHSIRSLKSLKRSDWWHCPLSPTTCWTSTLKLHVCPVSCHERSSPCAKGPHHRSAPSGEASQCGSDMYSCAVVNGTIRTSVLCSSSISGKRQLCISRTISTIKWRLPARSSALALWGKYSFRKQAHKHSVKPWSQRWEIPESSGSFWPLGVCLQPGLP